MTIKMNTNLQWLKEQAKAEANGIVSTGGLFVGTKVTERDEPNDTTERLALSRLVKLQRRTLKLQMDALAELAAIDLDELVDIENGTWEFIEPRTVFQLSGAFKIPAKHLMQLAGLVQKRDKTVHEGAIRFAAKSEPITKLSPEERRALAEFVELLSKD